MNIFVGSLSFKTTEEELQKEFEAFGEVDSVKIIMDHETRKSRGFAFVTMANQEQANAAIAALNGKQIDGFAIKVNEARPREPRGSGGRERSGSSYPSGNRSGSGPQSGYSGGGNYGRDRFSGMSNWGNSADLDIYDSKDNRRGGGSGKKGRDGNRGSGGRSGGGRRSY